MERRGFRQVVAVADEGDGARDWLICEETLKAKLIDGERCCSRKDVGSRTAIKDGQVGPRVVTQAVLERGFVLADETKEDGARELILDVEPRNQLALDQ